MDEIKKKRGRPKGVATKKTSERVQKIMELARLGKTTEEIAEIVDVGRRTIFDWMQRDFSFSALLKENRQLADEAVEASLFKRATGYTYKEEAATKNGVTELMRHAPPDPTSMIFWLKNRKPKEWRDKQEIDHVVSPGWSLGLGDGTKKV